MTRKDNSTFAYCTFFRGSGAGQWKTGHWAAWARRSGLAWECFVSYESFTESMVRI